MYYYQHHIGDFIRDTANLNDTQLATYLRMIWTYYDTEKPLCGELEDIAFAMRSDEKTVQLLLKHYFKQTEFGWSHTRCDKEIAEFHGKAEKARNSANARWTNAKAMRPQCERIANVPENDANQEPITKNQEPSKNSRFAPPTLDELITEFTGKVLMPEVEAKKFLGYYGSNDWKVGKNKMKSWKHAVAGWAARMPPVEQVLGFEQKHGNADWAGDLINQGRLT